MCWRECVGERESVRQGMSIGGVKSRDGVILRDNEQRKKASWWDRVVTTSVTLADRSFTRCRPFCAA